MGDLIFKRFCFILVLYLLMICQVFFLLVFLLVIVMVVLNLIELDRDVGLIILVSEMMFLSFLIWFLIKFCFLCVE